MIRALVVDDEPLARRKLVALLRDAGDVEVAGECPTGHEAIAAIRDDLVDLVFLDVQMPEVSGLDVVEAIGAERMPATVFVTAYDQYAVRAFEMHAVDYLLKPFGRERFRQAAERARQHLANREAPALHERARAALEERGSAPLERIFVRHRDRIVPVRVDDIAHLEAADDYVTVHAGGERYLVTLALGDLERRLNPARFVRVHRSHVVNLDHVASLRPYDDARRLVITLRDGSEVLASRAGSLELRGLIA